MTLLTLPRLQECLLYTCPLMVMTCFWPLPNGCCRASAVSMFCLQAIKRMQQEPTEAELMIVRPLPTLHVMCFAVRTADHKIMAGILLCITAKIFFPLSNIIVVMSYTLLHVYNR